MGKEGRGVKRRIPGEGQGGGLSAGTRSLGTPPPPSSRNPWDRGERRVRAMGPGTLPDPLVPVLTGHRPGGEAAGPSFSGTEPRQVLWPRPLQTRRPPCGPGPSGQRHTSSGSPPPHVLSGASSAPARRPTGGGARASLRWGVAGLGERLGELLGSPRSRALWGRRIPLLRVFRALPGAGSPTNRRGGRGQGSRQRRGKLRTGWRRPGGASVGLGAPTGASEPGGLRLGGASFNWEPRTSPGT